MCCHVRTAHICAPRRNIRRDFSDAHICMFQTEFYSFCKNLICTKITRSFQFSSLTCKQKTSNEFLGYKKRIPFVLGMQHSLASLDSRNTCNDDSCANASFFRVLLSSGLRSIEIAKGAGRLTKKG